ncbi:MAG: ChbG/HpnK family deacetylase [Armatimonadota bacterium]|nr:ChbG/HpnK family deacetylase [Armatimonadota bacterium]
MSSAVIRLITRGDDAGTNHTANVAIRDAFRHGILRNTSVMAPCAAVEEAAALLAREKGLCCGLHATITAEWDHVRWGPVLPPNRVPSLVDQHGHFFQTTRALHQNAPRLEEILAELQAQLHRLRSLGFHVHYADLHMGFGWVAEGLEEAFAAWCAQEGLIVGHRGYRRLPSLAEANDPVEALIAALRAAEPGTYLLVGHPAYDTPEMRALGHEGYPGEVVASGRDWQRRLFMDPRVLAACHQLGVQPIRYDEA